MYRDKKIEQRVLELSFVPNHLDGGRDVAINRHSCINIQYDMCAIVWEDKPEGGNCKGCRQCLYNYIDNGQEFIKLFVSEGLMSKDDALKYMLDGKGNSSKR